MTIQPLAHVEVSRQLSDAEITAVAGIVERVTEADGVRPLSEHVMLHLRYGGDSDVRHVLAWDASTEALLAYAHLDVTDPVDGPSAELAVDPVARGRGLGKALVERLRRESPDGRLRLWAHGEHAAASGLATSMGFTRSRVLWQMRRNLYAALEAPKVPEGITLRTFVPGQDDADWLALNARAFFDHPEQGGWTQTDLDNRIREPWFDPAGFFIAERMSDEGTPRIVGFHWTKVHGGHVMHSHDGMGQHTHEGHGHEPIGEIYVIATDPDDAGRGLGRALAITGLRHLRAAGLAEAMLYVEAENARAIALYESLGFRHWDTDIMFAAPRG
jgi:mycothiol synthase